MEFPEINGLIWRGVYPQDEEALKELDAACRSYDGDEPVSNLPGDVLRAAAVHGDNALCVTTGKHLVAAAWIFVDPPEDDRQKIQIGGKVHPEYRRMGIGEALIAWAESRALNLATPAVTLTLTIANEALTDDATALYLDYGYENTFTEFMLTCPLDDPMPDAELPDGFTERSWDDASAPLFFQAYAAGFQDRLGDTVPVKGEWIAEYAASDEHFRPDLSRLVMEGDTPAAFITCEVAEKTGWIAQIAVVPEYRNKGLARTLLAQAMKCFKDEGCTEAALHVNANNAHAATVFFNAGFARRLTRARFEKSIFTAA